MSGSSLFAFLGAALYAPLFSFKAFHPAYKANPALTAFETDLSAQLDHLNSIGFDNPGDGSSSLSMAWLCHAMKVVLSTHASVKTFLPEMKQTLVDGDTKWLDAYLDNSIKLLDTCNVLRDAIGEIHSYHAHVKLVLHALDKAYIGEAQLKRIRNALCACVDAFKRKERAYSNVDSTPKSKLENCSSLLRRMGDRFNIEDACKGDFFKVSHAAQVTTIFICGVLTATLSFKPLHHSLWAVTLAKQFSWAHALTALQQRLKEQMERQNEKEANALLLEFCMTNNVVHVLMVRVEKLLESQKFPLKAACTTAILQQAELLRDCSLEMKKGLDLLHQHVEDVVQILITSRMLLLGMSASHHVKLGCKVPYP